MRLLSKYRAQRSGPRLFTALSTPIRKYRDVFRLVGRTPLSARDAFVPPKSARGPTAVQGDRPTSAVRALNSLSYLRIGVLSRRSILGSVILLLAVIGAFAYPTVAQLGMTILKPGVQAGYVIFGAPDGNAYAIDTQGKVAKKWPSPEPNTELGYTRPLANGNLLARIQPSKSLAGAAGANAEVTGAGSVIELTQEGRVVWKYTDRK